MSAPSSGETRQGGGCFNILLMFCLAWFVIAFFAKKKEPAPVPEEYLPQAEQIQPMQESELASIAESISPDLKAEAQKKVVPQFVTLGSLDPNSAYRMLVTISNRGASVTRVEMNEKGFRDCADSSGYLGQIIADETVAADEIASGLRGLGVQAVGAGTPAAAAGLKPGDRIVSIDLSETESAEGVVEIASFEDLRDALLKTKPDETVKLGVLSKESISTEGDNTSEASQISVTLCEAPLQVIRPTGVIANYGDYVNMVGLQGVSRDDSNDAYDVHSEKEFRRRPNTDATSFLMTLATYDSKESLQWPVYHEGDRKTTAGRNSALDLELPFYAFGEDGILAPSDEAGMRCGDWEYVADESNESTAVFRKLLPGHRLEARKIFRLMALESAENEKKKEGAGDYSLNLTVELRNLDAEKHSVSYFLDGPTSLPVEGLWYSMGRKTGPGWGTYGLHDVVLKLSGNNFRVFKCTDIALEKKENSRPSDPVSIDFIGVDSQYFEATMIPDAQNGETPLYEYLPLRVGARLSGKETFTNTSFRLKSGEKELAPAGQTGDATSESYTVFIGPKRPAELKSYGLGETLVYGWFWFVSKPLAWILEFFRHYMVFNYGLAIILLTILVRLCMFPVSIKMVASSLRMQKLQPQISALQAKYKDDANALMRAQRELWKKNKVNPLGSCLPMFLQIPVFCGLYKVLNLDVNLYGAPLISEKVRWCSNLAAPDMLLNWSNFWNSHGWSSFNLGMGIFSLGPYLNLLPLLTVALFLVQQAILSPPVTGRTPEEVQQQKMMRVMMKVMMVMMGFMFFKVPCGLCIYFITSALWGILERRFLPKRDQELVTDDGAAVIDVTPAPVVSDAEKLGKPHNARRNRRTSAAAEPEKKGWRAKWQEILEKAKEQQKLAKAELEKRKKTADRRNDRKKRK